MIERYVPPRFRARMKRWISTHGILTVCVAAILPPPIPLTPFLLAAGALGVTRRQLLIAIGIARTIRYGKKPPCSHLRPPDPPLVQPLPRRMVLDHPLHFPRPAGCRHRLRHLEIPPRSAPGQAQTRSSRHHLNKLSLRPAFCSLSPVTCHLQPVTCLRASHRLPRVLSLPPAPLPCFESANRLPCLRGSSTFATTLKTASAPATRPSLQRQLHVALCQRPARRRARDPRRRLGPHASHPPPPRPLH